MRKFLLAFVLILIIGSIVAYIGYRSIFSSNTSRMAEESELFHVRSGAEMEELIDTLTSRSLIDDVSSFQKVASLMKFNKPKPGRYLIEKGWSNKTLISNLRSGRQLAVKLTFNNQRTIQELAGALSSQLQVDSTELINYITEEYISKHEPVSIENVLTLFIPNTYEVYWNTSAADLLKRFEKEHKKFWNAERREHLTEIGLTEKEAYTLASIVQKETLVDSEKPTVAGVYLNRLRRGQLLQADPTVVFANGDFTIRRVLNRHLEKDSPYNTYKYQGLPPGPIGMPDISTIDAVLKPENHRYLYFCASTDNSGRHVFAKTLVEHNRNANRYRAYLNKERIYR